jgi:hypothetical protein
LASEVAGVLALAAMRSQDRVGLLLFTDRVERYVRPLRGRNRSMRLLYELLSYQPEGHGTDIPIALTTAARLLRVRSLVFVVSDFVSSDPLTQSLLGLSRRHDVVAVDLKDPFERTLPRAGLIQMEDAESGEPRRARKRTTSWIARFVAAMWIAFGSTRTGPMHRSWRPSSRLAQGSDDADDRSSGPRHDEGHGGRCVGGAGCTSGRPVAPSGSTGAPAGGGRCAGGGRGRAGHGARRRALCPGRDRACRAGHQGRVPAGPGARRNIRAARPGPTSGAERRRRGSAGVLQPGSLDRRFPHDSGI